MRRRKKIEHRSERDTKSGGLVIIIPNGQGITNRNSRIHQKKKGNFLE